MRQVILYQDEDGAWVAEVPSLPGCNTQGSSREDALRNAAEAAELWIEAMREMGEAIPPDNLSAQVATIPLRVA